MKFTGQVIKGLQIGAKFGIATANLQIENKPDLKPGVYLVNIKYKDQNLAGLMHFGDLKTFGGGFSIEVHILDFETEIYGEILEIKVLKFLREIKTFPSGDALFTQIATDITHARKYFMRQEIKANWDNLTTDTRHQLVVQAIQVVSKISEFKTADVINAFAPDEYEINFVEALMDQFPDKIWNFPKIQNSQMTFYEVSNYTELAGGKFDLLAPTEKHLPAKHPDLVLVPAQAGNQTGHRLGRGGGFYDQFLSQIETHTLAILPEFANRDDIPCEKHDQIVDKIIFI